MDFRDRFAGAQAEPKFSEVPGLGSRTLPLPEKGDSLGRLSEKMISLKEVVEKGYSLATATGLRGTARHTTDPEEAAKQEMSASELKQYNFWQAGGRLHEFNPATCKEPLSKFRGNDSSLVRALAGLSRMYPGESLEKEHLVWFYVNASFMVPCIMAFCKIVGASRALTVPDKDLTADELAEYQTARKINGEAAFLVQEIKKTINKYTEEIGMAQRVILTRIRHYEPRVKGKPEKIGADPENDERRRMGLPQLRGPSNLGSLGKRARVGEREELGETRAARRRRVASPEYHPKSPRMGPETNPPEEENVVAPGLDFMGGDAMEDVVGR